MPAWSSAVSDGKHPHKIAFIQCVGSRDISCGKDYCSSVCCMYATKEAIIAKEHANFIEPTIFYMDIRAFGKSFDAYYETAKTESGVRYVKCTVSRVREDFKTKNLLITYMDEAGKIVEEEFDMVVLSVGLVPSKETVAMAKRLGVEVDNYGFARRNLCSRIRHRKTASMSAACFRDRKIFRKRLRRPAERWPMPWRRSLRARNDDRQEGISA